MIRSSIIFILSVAILAGFAQVAAAQYGGYGGGSFESGGNLRPTAAAPAPTVAPGPAAAPAYGGDAPMAGGGMPAEGAAFGDGMNRSRFGLLPDDGGMPQHYPYYPPLHGYYYFCPYHYSHVPAHQDFAGRIGIDPRNPYANDFFKMVYAEYRASQFRADPATSVPMAPPESPIDALRKLKGLLESGVINTEEFNAKKAEILSRI